MKSCEHCGKDFKPVKRSRRFCSKWCSTKATAIGRVLVGKCQLCGTACVGATVVFCAACRHGDVLRVHEERRFWSKVRRGNAEECWEWVGGSWNKNGYGLFHTSEPRKMVTAHRFSWKLSNGDAGDRLVCHHCDNPKCVNPAHLFLGTQQDNMADKCRKGRQARGERSGHVRLTEAVVMDIRARRAAGAVMREIAEALGLSISTVTKVANRQTWRHVG